MLPEPARLAVIPGGKFSSNHACRAAQRLACFRLQDGGEMSFSKKKCEKRERAGKSPPPPFPSRASRARLIFALLVLKYRYVPIILSERWLANEPSEKQDSG